ncbi:NUDIX hydrolase [Corynebacterium sp. 320]|uniref:NUDIX hydrolase n=1 Tax=Corynebacterium zhongnanshanii TaxID=2768834 RepID=A0ABQ6VGA5_9CORY|nr:MULTISPECIES: NUDIX hydrolase [Corynebacterium]KAB1503853.1 NUDIX hydrolase [Corynebacterium sp. 320]KAB1553046.1 NUDIX hydrolase [Corynebacterium sp. 321]KAB1553733.1 NUDIX hydrolase [Corynebacterium sp. 319]KAB3523295.1 NUDIX hydrolase [Corynebacterium zhongnanshanii]KAB3527989.1 NUDIX hydrolase [Corynebacterium sp. 250]
MISHNGTGDLSTSIALAHHEVGHVSRIGSKPAQEFAKPTFAAGALLWRIADRTADGGKDEELEVAVVHRPHYDDWSLPKGKVDAGENLTGTAVREIFEETGLRPRLGWLLGFVKYPVKDRTKVVYYWTAQVLSGEFVANDEVDELRWLPAAQAAELVSYDLDREVILSGVDHVTRQCDRRVILIRHAKAHDRKGWGGDDNLRPLAKKGRRQAELLVPQLTGYQPDAIVSAEPDRCQHTAQPLADALGLDVQVDPRFGDAAFEENPEAVVEALIDTVTSAPLKSVTAIVSQGTAIPGILERLLDPEVLVVDDIRVKKASAWVLHFSGDKLVGADYLASPFPVK